MEKTRGSTIRGRRRPHTNTISLATLLISTILFSQAWASDPPGDRQEAKRLRDAGAAAMDRGDVAEALVQFRAAYRVYPSLNSLYNIGVALDRLGRASEAVDAFEQFVAEAPEARSDARDFAAARLDELSPEVGRLTFSAAPADVAIAVDGQSLRLPRTRPLPVMPGEHEVTAERSGYVPLIVRVAVAATETVDVGLKLQPEAPAPSNAAPSSAPGLAQPGAGTAIGRASGSPLSGALPPKPLYKRWWLWTTVGIVAAGVGVGLGVGLSPRTEAGFNSVRVP
jgi:hypothetical protein